jgi:hypothetical protein
MYCYLGYFATKQLPQGATLLSNIEEKFFLDLHLSIRLPPSQSLEIALLK